MADGNSKSIREILRDMVVARASLVYLLTEEDRRVEMEVKSLAAAFKPPFRTYVWSCTTGVTHGDEVVVANPSLAHALDWYMKINETAFLLLNDIHIFLKDNPPIMRKLKDTAKAIDHGYKTVFMVAPTLEIPLELQSEVALVDVPLPQPDEIEKLLDQVVSKERHRETLKASLTREMRDEFVKGGAGLSSQQVIQAFRKTVAGRPKLMMEDMDRLFEEKRQIVRKSGLLELVPQEVNFDHLGGFGNLKRWLELRKDIFSQRARDYGLSLPKGVS